MKDLGKNTSWRSQRVRTNYTLTHLAQAIEYRKKLRTSMMGGNEGVEGKGEVVDSKSNKPSVQNVVPTVLKAGVRKEFDMRNVEKVFGDRNILNRRIDHGFVIYAFGIKYEIGMWVATLSLEWNGGIINQ